MRTREYRYYNNEKQNYYLFIKNNFDYLLINEYMIKKSVDCFYILIFLLPLHWNGQNEGLSLVYSFLLGYKQ